MLSLLNMESQPPQRFASQQSSQPQAPTPSTSFEATAPGQHRRSSIPQSTSSEDSQTMLLNHPSSSESSPKPEAQQQRAPSRPKPQSAPSTKEPRKCWICFGDETEDSPTSSQWRSPCPCALTAHEACLLDWVADLEAPAKRTPAKIECPQCKAKITIARPRSPIVEAVRAIERATGRLLIPFVLVTLAGTVITGCMMHGFSTVYLIFGPEDAERLLSIDNGLRISSKWGFTLPFIPMALIASRTSYADNLLPIIPIFYFASNAPRREGPLWPPSAAFTVATLPYIRAVYNELYSRVLAPKERAWAKFVQPRAGEGENDEGQEQEQNQEEAANEIPEGMNFELDLQVELVEEEEVEEEQQEQPEQPAGNRAEGDQAEAGEGQPQNPPQNQPHNHPHPQHAHPPLANQGGLAAGNFVIDAISTAQMVIGALVFPTVSAAVGILLKVALPKTWTTPPSRWDRYPAGFLQSRFGRSVAGGCLFIALKDTLILYSKYRLAQDHKKRRVVDYVKKKDGKATVAGSWF